MKDAGQLFEPGSLSDREQGRLLLQAALRERGIDPYPAPEAHPFDCRSPRPV